jgi:GR25 family glycosyltransferase involved in LPS biosynthesis/glycosyltransferase involved in cell wall biosynthesis
MSSICLNMIVKNEEHVIRGTLEKLVKQITFSYWVICDTGSTDKTREIITDFFKEQNIPGELLQHEWRDFGHNRTLALQGAFKKADYIFIFDADDTIHGTINIPILTRDFYKLKFGHGFTYYRPLLVTARKKTKFMGVLHEYLALEQGYPSEGTIEGNYYVDSGKTGARSRDKDKYLKDAIILKAAYQKEVETKGGLANRYAFYCAQSFKDANKPDDAIEWYTLVADKLNSWAQEKYYSCIMLGFQYRGKGNFQKALEYFLKAEQFDPDRTEGVIFAVEMLKDVGLHSLVMLLYEKHKNYNKNPQDKLFLLSDFYRDVLEFNVSISAFYFGNKQVSYECIKKITVNNIAQQNIIDRAFKNLRFHASELNDDPNTLTLFYRLTDYIQCCDEPREASVLWDILFKKNRTLLTKPSQFKPNPSKQDVIITFTSCKRLDLFTETVNSILNHWTDADQIGSWFCVDDNSSKEDRSKMKKLYPWITFYNKTQEEKGHRESMNIIWNKLNEMKPKYWIHMEDDFLFHVKRPYVQESIKFLKSQKDIKQVLFNRAYAETIRDVDLKGYLPVTPGFVVHDYKQGQFPYRNCHYWPHYSFRPSMIDVGTILRLGNYDSPNTFFGMDYANKWLGAGYKSAFFDMVTCRHTGRLTSERNDKSVKNAYDLNNETQFNQEKGMKVVNLKRRSDRKETMTAMFNNIGFTDYEFVEAVDGKELKATIQLKKMFGGNDFGSNVGFIGCALSHYNLWKALLASNDEYYVIFEDDVTLVPKFKEKFETLKSSQAFKKCDYLLLGYSMFSANREATADVYVKEKSVLDIGALQSDLYVGGTFAYSINRNGAQILVDYIAKNGIKHGIDYVVKICRELKPMELRPQLVFTDWYERPNQAVDTDIQTEMAKLDFNNIVEDFTFIQGVDQIGNDSFFKRGSPEELMAAAMADPNCAGFNTLGFFKSKIDKNSLQPSQYFGEKDGIYIKNTPNKPLSLKLIGHWQSSKEMAREFGSMGTDMELTWKDEADYYVIVNMPHAEEVYDPKKSIIFQMEPWVYDDKKRWGVKTWGLWANPDPSKFLHVHNRRFLNPAQWTLKGDLVNFPAKQNDSCIILSHKKHDSGHRFRLDVLSGGKIDVYGKENYHSLEKYKGVVSDDNRYNVYSKYKYVLAVENNSEINYATEKIWEPLICECLPFYWGCPNLEDHIDPQAFVRLPDDPLKAAEIIQQAVDEDWWSRRIDKIREAKKKVMTELGFFSVISQIIRKNTV